MIQGGGRRRLRATGVDGRSNSGDVATGQLEVHLLSGPNGCLARFVGDLIGETRGAIWGVEEILLHDARVAMDLSGVTSFDCLGLEAALGLMDAVRLFGGVLTIGDEVGMTPG